METGTIIKLVILLLGFFIAFYLGLGRKLYGSLSYFALSMVCLTIGASILYADICGGKSLISICYTLIAMGYIVTALHSAINIINVKNPEETKIGCVALPIGICIICVLMYGFLKEIFAKELGYEEKVKITNITSAEDNSINVHLSNGEFINANKTFSSYQYQIGDSIFIRHDKDNKPIYAGKTKQDKQE